MSAPATLPFRTPVELRGDLGRVIRRDGSQSPAAVEIRGDLAVSKIAKYVQQALADAPPLNDSQRADLAAIFQAGGNDTSAATS